MDAMKMLHEIVAADKAARLRVEDARRERESFDDRLAELGREISESAMDRVEKDVDAARKQSRAEASSVLAELDRARDEAMEGLRRQFSERREAGIEELFRMVVGQDD